MRDPLAWSIPLCRLFGVNIRVHWLYPVGALFLILPVALRKGPGAFPENAWIDATILTLIAFFSTVLHELGHCFGARYVDGDAQEVLVWPLGGLASVEVPHTPRANFIATAAGPAVNLLLCVAAGVLLLVVEPSSFLRPLWNPLGYVLRYDDQLVKLFTWRGAEMTLAPYSLPVLVAWVFFVNWVLLIFNLALVGYPMGPQHAS